MAHIGLGFLKMGGALRTSWVDWACMGRFLGSPLGALRTPWLNWAYAGRCQGSPVGHFSTIIIEKLATEQSSMIRIRPPLRLCNRLFFIEVSIFRAYERGSSAA